MSEIDDIFSSKGSSNLIESISPAPNPDLDKKQKKKRTKRKREREASPSISAKHQPVPEIIVDRSAPLPIPKRPKTDKSTEKATMKSVKDGEEKNFTDSRGVGTRKKTEEGWNVYNEEELGLLRDGGDTALCPFDCNCCF